MKKINIGHLDSLFSCLDGTNHVLWARSKEYNKQLYISPSYEDVWEIPTSVLYEDPGSFMGSINRDEFSDHIFNAIKDRKIESITKNQSEKTYPFRVFFRIKTPNGKLKHVYDTPMLLIDNNNNILGFCGIAGELSQEAWHQQYNDYLSSTFDHNSIQKKIIAALQQESGLTVSTNQPEIHQIDFVQTPTDLTLSKRENEILKHLMLGLSAKQIAKALTLSHRTVETHLSNIKNKFQCRTITELLCQIIIHNKSVA